MVEEDFDSLGLGDKRGVLRRLAELEQAAAAAEDRRPVEARMWDLECAVAELDDKTHALSMDLGIAFLLIAAVCWAIVLSKRDG